MQVRVCPNCAAENSENHTSCWNCYASLNGVPLTQSSKSSQTVTTRIPTAQVPVGQQQAPVSQQPQAPMPPGTGQPPTQPQGYKPSPIRGYSFRDAPLPEPVKSSSGVWPLVIILVLLVVGYGGYVIWQRSIPEPAVPPDKVVIAFLEAKKTGDVEQVVPYLCKGSVDTLRNALSSRQAKSAGFERAEVHSMFLFGQEPTLEHLKDSKIEAARLQDKEADENTAIVLAKVTMNLPLVGIVENEFEYVLIKEKNEWKVDLLETNKRAPLF